MSTQTLKIQAKQGLVLPISFWQKLGIRQGEELVVQENAPVVTLIPKSLFAFYKQRARPLSLDKLKKMGIEDQEIWQQEEKDLREIRKKLNQQEYPSLYA